MKQVKVITRHTPSNYGSLLQSIATQRVIESLGYDCQIIDYRIPWEQGIKRVQTLLNQKESWNSSFLKRLLYKVVSTPNELIAELAFTKMQKKYLKLTNICTTVDELKKLRADVFVTGSDQVWGPLMNGKYDKSYFLSFVDGDAKKISYAASFGKISFDTDVENEYYSMLNKYQHITVREKSAKKLLEKIGVACEGQVLDPTLLLNQDQWSSYIKNDYKQEYVLVYQIHNNKQLDLYAKKFAEKMGLPLIRVAPYLHQISRSGCLKLLPDIGEFLSYIKNCKYMVTDSFHGTAFAINFNKQFVEILPTNGTGTRNQSVLELTGLVDRVVTDLNDFSITNKNIDYVSVNRIIAQEREKSKFILKKMLDS